MATKRKLYAKDRRKLKRRRWTSVALTVGGGAALIFIGWFLFRKIVADAAPAPGQRKDWEGCILEPPDWVQPRPKFSCGQRVIMDYYESENAIDGLISARTWKDGNWYYALLGEDSTFEEHMLREAD